MPAPDFASRGLSEEAAGAAGDIAELLDVMWERARQATAGAAAPTSLSQLRVMYLVDRAEGVRMRALCRELGSTPPSVSRLCDRLQALGFVERLPCPDSGREVALRLTTAGRTHLQRIREQRRTMLHGAIDAMPPAERRALALGLTGLHAQLTRTTGQHGRTGRTSAA